MSRISEMLSGNTSSSEQQQQQIRDAVWQHLVEENLFITYMASETSMPPEPPTTPPWAAWVSPRATSGS